jgi:hypothetical protein
MHHQTRIALLAILLAACRPIVPPTMSTPTNESTGVATELAAAETATATTTPTATAAPTLNTPDYWQEENNTANAVLAGMQGDLLACYRKRLVASPNAHGYITVDIHVAPDGHVLDVETTGGAVLGRDTMACIIRRIEKGSFEPPHGGGTREIVVPISLDQFGDDVI